MSNLMKKPVASALSSTRRTLSTQLARSTSRPSCVSFNEILRPMPAATTASMIVEVLAGGVLRLRQAGQAFPEMVERQRHPPRFDGSARLDGLGGRLAGDEPAREAGRPAHAVARREFFEGSATCEKVKESLRRRVEHQCVVPGVSRRWSTVWA